MPLDQLQVRSFASVHDVLLPPTATNPTNSAIVPKLLRPRHLMGRGSSAIRSGVAARDPGRDSSIATDPARFCDSPQLPRTSVASGDGAHTGSRIAVSRETTRCDPRPDSARSPPRGVAPPAVVASHEVRVLHQASRRGCLACLHPPRAQPPPPRHRCRAPPESAAPGPTARLVVPVHDRLCPRSSIHGGTNPSNPRHSARASPTPDSRQARRTSRESVLLRAQHLSACTWRPPP